MPTNHMLQPYATLTLQTCKVVAGSIHWCLVEVHPLAKSDVSRLMRVCHKAQAANTDAFNV